jgi:hypothetical protein
MPFATRGGFGRAIVASPALRPSFTPDQVAGTPSASPRREPSSRARVIRVPVCSALQLKIRVALARSKRERRPNRGGRRRRDSEAERPVAGS